MDRWYVLFTEDERPKWAPLPSRAHAIDAARQFIGAGVAVIEVGPLDPGAAGDPIIGGDLRELCRTFRW
ncbi:MAG TPA: hypothetical protein VFA50_09840 [Stellaceae bacterium]|nr:hypothetical protein [Stellaceae bacterium]